MLQKPQYTNVRTLQTFSTARRPVMTYLHHGVALIATTTRLTAQNLNVTVGNWYGQLLSPNHKQSNYILKEKQTEDL